MKKILLTLSVAGLSVLPVLSVLAAAATTAPTVDVMATLDRIVDWLFTILLVIAALFIIIAAYYFVTAAGDPETVKKARNFVLYALIGLVVAFLARGLVVLIGTIVGP